MTHIHYPTVRFAAKMDKRPGYVTCQQGGKQIEVILGLSGLPEEEQKKIRKEVAREKAKIDAYNPSMQETGVGLFGGGDSAQITIPLWDYLTPYEKRKIRRAVHLHNKGDYAQLAVENDGVTNLNKIIKAIEKKALEIPREKRTTRHGVSYRTQNDNQSNQPRYAGAMENRKK